MINGGYPETENVTGYIYAGHILTSPVLTNSVISQQTMRILAERSYVYSPPKSVPVGWLVRQQCAPY